MTFEQLPDYCRHHTCVGLNKEAIDCKQKSLCTRFIKKYGVIPTKRNHDTDTNSKTVKTAP